MSNYAYQIKGALEDSARNFLGFRVIVCDANHMDCVDVPAEVLDHETAKYLEFRLKVSEVVDIRKLPHKIENRIRAPLGRWLDQWVLENFYGYTSKRKSINT